MEKQPAFPQVREVNNDVTKPLDNNDGSFALFTQFKFINTKLDHGRKLGSNPFSLLYVSELVIDLHCFKGPCFVHLLSYLHFCHKCHTFNGFLSFIHSALFRHDRTLWKGTKCLQDI